MASHLTLLGRRSSHYTRTALMFARELEVTHELEPCFDLTSPDAANYADNPALRLPILKLGADRLFGTLNICRELARRSTRGVTVVWPEDLSEPLLANAQELVLQGMASEVTLIMAGVAGVVPEHPFLHKPRRGLEGTVAWLDRQLSDMLARLPARDLSFLEVSLYCFTTHLVFRKVMALDGYPHVAAFCDQFGRRASARDTEYRFDPKPAAS